MEILTQGGGGAGEAGGGVLLTCISLAYIQIM